MHFTIVLWLHLAGCVDCTSFCCIIRLINLCLSRLFNCLDLLSVAYTASLILDILWVFVMIPSDQHVFIKINWVHILYFGWPQACMVLVKVLSFRLSFDHPTQAHEIVLSLLLSLSSCFDTRFEGCTAISTDFAHNIGHLLLICLKECDFFFESSSLVESVGFLCHLLSLLLEGLGWCLCSLHLCGSNLTEVDIHDLVLVLVFLARQELKEAGVSLTSLSGWVLWWVWALLRWALLLTRDKLHDTWNGLQFWCAVDVVHAHISSLSRAVQVVERAYRDHWRWLCYDRGSAGWGS